MTHGVGFELGKVFELLVIFNDQSLPLLALFQRMENSNQPRCKTRFVLCSREQFVNSVSLNLQKGYIGNDSQVIFDGYLASVGNKVHFLNAFSRPLPCSHCTRVGFLGCFHW